MRLRCGLQHGGHQQRRQADAPARTPVIQAQQQTAAWRIERPQARRHQAARDEHEGAGHPCQQALQQERRRFEKKAAQPHEQRGQHRTDQHQGARRPAPQQQWRGQRTQQVAQGVDGVHGPGQGVRPAQVCTHGRQQQRIGKPRDAQRHRSAHGQRQREPQQLGARDRRAGVQSSRHGASIVPQHRAQGACRGITSARTFAIKSIASCAYSTGQNADFA